MAAADAGRNMANGKPFNRDLLIALAGQRHDLSSIALNRAPIESAIGSEIGLHPGTARRILRAHFRALQEQVKGAGPDEPTRT